MKYKTETVIEAIRLKEAGVTTSAISKKLLAPTSTINEWLKKAKQKISLQKIYGHYPSKTSKKYSGRAAGFVKTSSCPITRIFL